MLYFLLKASNDSGRRLFLALPLDLVMAAAAMAFLLWRRVLCKTRRQSQIILRYERAAHSACINIFVLQMFLYQSHFNIYLIPIKCIRKSSITWWYTASSGQHHDSFPLQFYKTTQEMEEEEEEVVIV